MRKFILLLLVVAGVAAVAYTYATREEMQSKRRGGVRQTVAVETATIKPTDLSDRSIFTGSVRASERFDAAAKITELIKEIKVDAGDVVRRGDVLVVLDDESYVLKVEQEEATLAVSKANANDAASQLEITRRDYERAQRLRDETVISAQEFDKYAAAYTAQQAKYEVAMAQVNLSEATLKAAKVQLSNTRIVADWSGGSDVRIVSRRYLDAGAMARANEQILTIIDIDMVKAVVTVNERDYPKIAVGFPVDVKTDAFPDRVFRGEVLRIAQELGEMNREAEIEIGVANEDLALKPGMFIRAEIEFSHRDNAPAAPLEAVIRRETGDRGIFVVDRESSKVSFRPVTEGIHDKGWVEIVNGGDLVGKEVVILGQHLLKDGTTVIVAEES